MDKQQPHGCPSPQSDQAGKASACEGCPMRSQCSSGAFKQVDPALAQVAQRLSGVKHKILVLSGKGGVGKSTFTAQLGWYLASELKKQIGVLDIDICGPSMPRMFNVEDAEVHHSALGWQPVYPADHDNIGVMSVGFMLQSRDDAIIWRGPRKNGLIKQFLTDVNWGDSLDFLLVDSPPGTSDEHISIVQYLKNANIDGAVILTTPQEVSLLAVRKEITFCKKTGVPVLGVVENMSGFVCPHCNKISDIFLPTTGGAAKMCEQMGVPLLGKVPLDPELVVACEKGESYFSSHPAGPVREAYASVIANIMKETEKPRPAPAPAPAPASGPAPSPASHDDDAEAH